MKKVGEIMKEMGFNPDSSEGTQKAFIKYLVRVANKGKLTPEAAHFDAGAEPEEWHELKTHSRGTKKPDQGLESKTEAPKIPAQLSFAFDEDKKKDQVG